MRAVVEGHSPFRFKCATKSNVSLGCEKNKKKTEKTTASPQEDKTKEVQEKKDKRMGKRIEKTDEKIFQLKWMTKLTKKT